LTREPDGTFGTSAKTWDEKQAFLPDPALKVRMVAGRLRVARRPEPADAADEYQLPDSDLVEGQISEFE
jgi:hypothetical protein